MGPSPRTPGPLGPLGPLEPPGTKDPQGSRDPYHRDPKILWTLEKLPLPFEIQNLNTEK